MKSRILILENSVKSLEEKLKGQSELKSKDIVLEMRHEIEKPEEIRQRIQPIQNLQPQMQQPMQNIQPQMQQPIQNP